MDIIVVIMFGSVIATMSALTFLEVRRIRKLISSKQATLRRESPPPETRS